MTQPGKPARAVLLDIDGTLVDSNYLHVQAWSEAFGDIGAPVDTWRIHRAIGMDSGKMLEALLGDRSAQLGERAQQAHGDRYAALAPRLRPFRQARELLSTLDQRGLQVVLATSAPQEELSRLLDVLDAQEWIAHVTSAEDVESAKPEPDIVQVALRKAGVEPADALLVGDAVWDAESARRVGVGFVGLLSGGTSTDDLESAGALAVYDDVSALLADLDNSPLAGLIDGLTDSQGDRA